VGLDISILPPFQNMAGKGILIYNFFLKIFPEEKACTVQR
jgi:hypothetical protein